MLLAAEDCILFIVDIQARLAPAIAGADEILRRTDILLTAATRLNVPVVVSEQYPHGLGSTDERLALPDGAHVFAKLAFSAAAEPVILAHLESLGRRRLVLCGMEAHVCVLQSALGFKELGWAVAVVADAVGSRQAERRQVALERMRDQNIAIVDSEMVVFEWLATAAAPDFKELSRLIR